MNGLFVFLSALSSQHHRTKAEQLRRLVCKDVIEHILRYKSVKDLEQRIEAIEQRLAGA